MNDLVDRWGEMRARGMADHEISTVLQEERGRRFSMFIAGIERRNARRLSDKEIDVYAKGWRG